MLGKNERENSDKQAGKALLVQHHQAEALKDRTRELDSSLERLASLNDANTDGLDELLRQAKQPCCWNKRGWILLL